MKVARRVNDESTMGIASSRIWSWGDRHKVTRLFGTFAVLIVTAISLASFAFAPQTAYAAPNCGWISDKTIRCTDGNTTTNLVDANPNDAVRIFKASPIPTWCKVAGVVDTITMGSSPASATYSDMVTPEPIVGDVGDVITPDKVPKVDCKVQSSTISLNGVAAAGRASTNCEDRAGGAVQACLDELKDGNAAFAQSCGGPYPSTTGICTASTPPAYTTANPNGNPTGNADNKEPDPCDSLGTDFTLSWVACPVLKAASGMADGLDGLIEENLHYDTNIFNTTTAGGKGFYSAWSAFRSIALALVLIAGLIMVVSQGTGMQIVDAYTIRKILPRLLMAVIGITLSWELLEFIITFFNDMGHWVQDLILLPFQSTAGGADNINGVGEIAGAGAALTAAIIGAGAYLIRIGPLGLLSLAGTVLLALLVAWLVLVVRSVAITVIVLFAPLAMACYILPNTKKVWDFWQNALVTMLMVFPIIMALLASGKAMSLVATEGVMKVLFFVAPYFFIPFAFKLAGGLMATIFSIANDRGKGGFDRLRNTRQNQAKQRMQDAVEGRNNNWVGRSGMGKMARRAQLGGFSPGQLLTANGRAKYAAANRKFLNENAHKMVENDHGLATGDDDAMALAIQQGMTREKFVNALAYDQKDANGRVIKRGRGIEGARQALAVTEAGLGARMGTDAMAVSAFKARAASGTGYAPGDYEQIAQDGAGLMNRGLITNAEAMAAVKANQKRADINGVGAGTYLSFFDQVAARQKANPGTPLVSAGEAAALRSEALQGSGPGMVVGGRHEAVTALAPQMLDNLNQAFTSGDQVRIGRELAAVAGRYDAMSQVSPKNAEIMADLVMSQAIPSAGQYTYTNAQNQQVTANLANMNVQQITEMLRDDEHFRTMRREYGGSAIQQAGTQAAAAAAANTPGQTPPPGGMPVNSDRRLKQNIVLLGTIAGTDIPLYRFRYKLGHRTFVGVMAQDILETHPEAVSVDNLGYYRVDYGVLGTQMYAYEDWLKLQASAEQLR
jgi:hypothetical protein